MMGLALPLFSRLVSPLEKINFHTDHPLRLTLERAIRSVLALVSMLVTLIHSQERTTDKIDWLGGTIKSSYTIMFALINSF